MKIESIGKDKIKVTTETKLEITFWDRVKEKDRKQEEEIKALKRNIRILEQELSFLNK